MGGGKFLGDSPTLQSLLRIPSEGLTLPEGFMPDSAPPTESQSPSPPLNISIPGSAGLETPMRPTSLSIVSDLFSGQKGGK